MISKEEVQEYLRLKEIVEAEAERLAKIHFHKVNNKYNPNFLFDALGVEGIDVK